MRLKTGDLVMGLAKLGRCLAIAGVLFVGNRANAQQDQTISSLAAQGFEVKAAYRDGTKYVFVLQKGKDVFQCYWVNVSGCGPVR